MGTRAKRQRCGFDAKRQQSPPKATESESPPPSPPPRALGHWTTNEDAALATAVAVHGDARWSRLSALVPGRNGKQCRERWFHHLRPGTNKGPFDYNEDRMLMNAVDRMGHQWQRIAREVLPTRSDNHVKNRWYAITKKPKKSWNANAKAHRDLCAASTVLTKHDLDRLVELNRLAAPPFTPLLLSAAPVVRAHDQLPPPAQTTRSWVTALSGSPTGTALHFCNRTGFTGVGPFDAINRAMRRLPDARALAYDGLPRQFVPFK